MPPSPSSDFDDCVYQAQMDTIDLMKQKGITENSEAVFEAVHKLFRAMWRYESEVPLPWDVSMKYAAEAYDAYFDNNP